MLIFTLKKEWYEKICSGEKSIEYREVKPYWTRRIKTALADAMFGGIGSYWKIHKIYSLNCILRLGYTKRQMTARITKIEVVDGKDTDLRVDKPVYAIHLANVREN